MKNIKYIIILVLGMSLFLVGCSSDSSLLGNKESKKAVESYFKNIKNGDKSTVEELSNKIRNYDKLKSEEGTNSDDATDIMQLQGDDFYKKFFSKLDYKILKVDEQKDTATVTADITNIDMTEFMGDFLVKAMSYAVSSFGKNQDEIDKGLTDLLIEQFGDKDIKTVTKKINIKLEKEDGNFKITQDHDFVDAVSGGLSELDFSEMDFDK